MNLKGRLKRLERKMTDEMEEFTLEDGTTARLSAGAGLEAFCACMDNVMASATGAPLKPVPYADVLRRAVATDRSGTLVDFVRGMLNRESNNE